MKQVSAIFFWPICIIAATMLHSCTLVGYGIGALIDGGHSHDTTMAFSKPIFQDIKENCGKFSRIQYNDSTVKYAVFEDFSNESSASYYSRFPSFVENHSPFEVPFRLGDSIGVADIWGEKHIFNFCGYSPTTRGAIDSISYLESLGIKYIYRLSDSGALHDRLPKKYTRDDLYALMQDNALPVRSTLKFRNNEKTFTMTNSDFEHVTIINNTKGRTYGIIIGALIDVGLFVYAVANGFGTVKEGNSLPPGFHILMY